MRTLAHRLLHLAGPLVVASAFVVPATSFAQEPVTPDDTSQEEAPADDPTLVSDYETKVEADEEAAEEADAAKPPAASSSADPAATGDPCARKRMQTRSDEDTSYDDSSSDGGGFVTCDDAKAGSGSGSLTAAGVLRSGLRGGKISLRSAGKVTQVLTEGCGPRPKAKRVVLGRASRTLVKAGSVELTIKLNRVGKAKLRRAQGKVCMTLATKITLRGAKAHATKRSVWMQPGATVRTS